MSILRELLAETVSLEASDLHIKSEAEACVRQHGKLRSVTESPLSTAQVSEMLEEIIPDHMRDIYAHGHEADFSLALPDVGRFRVNAFLSHGQPNMVFRHVKTQIPTIDELRLPSILKNVALSPRGIILAAGSTGSGKSTTLAGMLQHINMHQHSRIITIEDPIEYLFTDQKAIISQREVGLDTQSFGHALKHVLRQDPDVIMVGEMRDASSFMAALAAAETGHLVMSTLHTGTAPQSINRILDFFPASERDQVRMSLASNLRAVVCQRLIPRIGGTVIPACEILINTPTVRKLIEKNKLDVLEAAVETGREDGMQTFNQAVYNLIKAGKITERDGLLKAGNPEALRMNLKGIFLDEASRILAT